MKSCPTCDRQYSPTDPRMRCPYDQSLLVLQRQDPLIGSVIAGRFQLQVLIKHGGWSRVYRAADLGSGALVAVKVLQSHLATHPEKVKRFQKEAAAAAKLLHPSIIGVHDFGLLPEGLPFLVMEYVDGNNLADLIRRGPLPWQEALQIAGCVCEALATAHQSGIVHRDVKPSNIMVAGSGDRRIVKIVDFGVAKVLYQYDTTDLTSTGETIGTPSYMSPEQFMASDIDERSDIYSLGCVLYEALTGVKALKGDTSYGYMYKHITEMPASFSAVYPGNDFPDGLEEVVFRCLAKKPEDRYQSAAQLNSDLCRILSGSRLERRSRPRLPASPKADSRSGPVIPYAVPVTVALVAGLAGFGYFTAAGMLKHSFDRKRAGDYIPQAHPAGTTAGPEHRADGRRSPAGQPATHSPPRRLLEAVERESRAAPPGRSPGGYPQARLAAAARVRQWTSIDIPNMGISAWLKSTWTDGQINVRLAMLGQKQALDYFLSGHRLFRITLVDSGGAPLSDMAVLPSDMRLAPPHTNHGIPTYEYEGSIGLPLELYEKAFQWHLKWDQ